MKNILTNCVNLGKIIDMYCGVGKNCEEVRRWSALFSFGVSGSTLFALVLCVLAATSFAGYSDGLISKGEFEGAVFWSNNDTTLLVDGGGAIAIDVLSYAKLEVRSTSTPINGNWYIGGIRDIWLDDYSHLDYYSGYADTISLDENSTAKLYGGNINYLISYQETDIKHITLYCQPGWSWIGQESNYTGITGLWNDGTAFSINFIDDDWGNYPATWTNINIITPEPTSLLFLVLGGLLARKR